jgi:hypothetical protein
VQKSAKVEGDALPLEGYDVIKSTSEAFESEVRIDVDEKSDGIMLIDEQSKALRVYSLESFIRGSSSSKGLDLRSQM